MRRAELLNQEPTLNNYQNLALNTAVYKGQGTFQGLCYCLFKLAGEAGEVNEKMGKLLRDNSVEWDSDPKSWPDEIHEAFVKELGDVLWYIGGVAKELGFTMQHVGEVNLEKLESRQERGKIHGSGDNR
jgi:NTP pyrophosphatase (non-canonical NTP hydrolase)